MTKHDLSYEDFVLAAQMNGVRLLLVEITPNLPAGMRHTYAPNGERILGCYGNGGKGVWFNAPKRWEQQGRKFKKVYI